MNKISGFVNAVSDNSIDYMTSTRTGQCICCVIRRGGREGGREGEREGEREGGREGGMEGGSEGGREG